MNQKTMVFVFGTRPEFIKMIPLILAAKKKKNIRSVVCSTGQHREMLDALYSFFDFKPDIDFMLMRPNQNLIDLHAETMHAMNQVIENFKPDWVVVQGDTTSAHAAAMSAFYQKVPVAHVEAGLRTYDIHSPFPEEMNRRAIGLVAQAHLCPTNEAALNLRNEKTDYNSFINVTGNTGIDTLNLVSKKIESSDALKRIFEKQFYYLGDNKFILATMHRRENFGYAQQEILKAFLEIIKLRNINILFPVHPNPNVRKSVEEVYRDEMNKNVFWTEQVNDHMIENKNGKIFLTDPLDYPALVYVMKECHFLMTDSGGLQEEAPTFGKKILVLRNSTERPEGVKAGFSKLVGTDYQAILRESLALIDQSSHWSGRIPYNPYGDGYASERILKSLLSESLDESIPAVVN